MVVRARSCSSRSSHSGTSFTFLNDRTASPPVDALRPATLGLVLASLVAVAVGARDRQTRNSHQLASARVSPVLDVEEPTPDGSAAGRSRSPHADSNDVDGQSALGCPSDSRRVAETRHDRLANDRREIHGPAPTDRPRRRGGRSWRTTCTNWSRPTSSSCPTTTCRLLFVLVLLAHDRRRIVHIAVTDHPTAAWTAQQLREAFPWDDAPRISSAIVTMRSLQ